MTSQDWIKNRTVYLVRIGSKAYGTDNESSDEDLKGVCIPPIDYFFGYHANFEQQQTTKPDSAIYNIKKYFKLMADCNPSIIETAFVREEDQISIHPVMRLMLANKREFLSKRARHTFSGYAIAQLKKLQLDESAGREINYKHAMHLVRLMRMGKEILENGEVNVYRKDREELKAIRKGAWSVQQIVEYANYMDNELEVAESKSELPWGPNHNLLNSICTNICKAYVFPEVNHV
jgi:predicted nucleotidyltransferase